jgi:exodeoxyribonuclease VII small subunit
MKFEEAYSRLEEILEKMNSGKASLDDSLKLYEEADKLIVTCQKKLSEAEKKIEMMIKNRNGEVVLDETGNPTFRRSKYENRCITESSNPPIKKLSPRNPRIFLNSRH